MTHGATPLAGFAGSDTQMASTAPKLHLEIEPLKTNIDTMICPILPETDVIGIDLQDRKASLGPWVTNHVDDILISGNTPIPCDPHNLRVLLGSFGFVQEFVPDYAEITCSENKGQTVCGAAAICIYPELDLRQQLQRMSAQGCEVYAVLMAFQATPLETGIVVCSGSMWTVQGLLVWAPIWEKGEYQPAYWDFWTRIIMICRQRQAATYVIHTGAHKKRKTMESYYNDLADKAAKEIATREVAVVTRSQGKDRKVEQTLEVDAGGKDVEKQGKEVKEEVGEVAEQDTMIKRERRGRMEKREDYWAQYDREDLERIGTVQKGVDGEWKIVIEQQPSVATQKEQVRLFPPTEQTMKIPDLVTKEKMKLKWTGPYKIKYPVESPVAILVYTPIVFLFICFALPCCCFCCFLSSPCLTDSLDRSGLTMETLKRHVVISLMLIHFPELRGNNFAELVPDFF